MYFCFFYKLFGYTFHLLITPEQQRTAFYCVLYFGRCIFYYVLVLWFVNKGELRDANQVQLFKLGSEENMMCVVYLDDYKSHVLRFVDEHKLDRCVIGLYLFLFI